MLSLVFLFFITSSEVNANSLPEIPASVLTNAAKCMIKYGVTVKKLQANIENLKSGSNEAKAIGCLMNDMLLTKDKRHIDCGSDLLKTAKVSSDSCENIRSQLEECIGLKKELTDAELADNLLLCMKSQQF